MARIKSVDFKKGFSMIEVIVAIMIFLVAMFGVVTLISFNIANASLLRNRLIAANLAQEGIEIARNMRDNNFLAGPGTSWDRNFNDSACLAVNYDTPDPVTNLGPSDLLYLHPDSQLYDHRAAGGNPSIFHRCIGIRKLPRFSATTTEIVITSTVKWRDRGMTQDSELIAEDHLFDWK